MKFVGIPARMGSSRLPGKPLVDICGVPMIAHVYERTKMVFSTVLICSPDKEIWNFCAEHSIPFVKIPQNGPDTIKKPGERVYRAAKLYGCKQEDTLITIQGDEPFINPDMLTTFEAWLPYTYQNNYLVHMMTDCEPDDIHNKSEVKVAFRDGGLAIYFSREPIPGNMYLQKEIKYYKQVCIFAMDFGYATKFYDIFQNINAELPEAIEMNRVIEYGGKIWMRYTPSKTKSVDTLTDLEIAREMMAKDPLFEKYKDKYLKKG